MTLLVDVDEATYRDFPKDVMKYRAISDSRILKNSRENGENERDGEKRRSNGAGIPRDRSHRAFDRSSGTINSETGPAARREARLVIATLVTRQAARLRANEFARKLRAACAQISRRMQNAACHARREFSCRAWYFSPSLLAWLQRKSGYLT